MISTLARHASTTVWAVFATTVLAGLAGHVAVEARRSALRRRHSQRYNARPLAARLLSVPHVVHVFSTSKTEEMRVMMQANPGWDVRVHNVSAARAYMKKHCSDYVDVFDAVVPVAYKADVWRLCALWTAAGIYLDDDLLPVRPLAEIAIANTDGLLLVDDLPHTNWWGEAIFNGTFNAFMGVTRPRHPWFACALSHVAATVRGRVVPALGNNYLSITGPQALTVCGGTHVYRMDHGVVATGSCPDGHPDVGCNVVAIHKPFKEQQDRLPSYTELGVDMFYTAPARGTVA